MKKYFDILHKCPLFFNIEEEDLPSLLGCLGAKVYSYGKKDIIMHEGTTVRSIGIVLTGSVQVVQNDFFGNRSIVSEITPSLLFGEAFACVQEKEIPVSIVANENSEIMFIDCNRALHPCAKPCDFHSKIIYNLMQNMALKNISFHQKLQITSKRTTREKLLSYLSVQSRKNASKSFEIPFDRQELADYLEVDRSGLSAEIGKLKNEGILESKKRFFKLLK